MKKEKLIAVRTDTNTKQLLNKNPKMQVINNTEYKQTVNYNKN